MLQRWPYSYNRPSESKVSRGEVVLCQDMEAPFVRKLACPRYALVDSDFVQILETSWV